MHQRRLINARCCGAWHRPRCRHSPVTAIGQPGGTVRQACRLNLGQSGGWRNRSNQPRALSLVITHPVNVDAICNGSRGDFEKNSLSCVHASRHIPIDLENSPAGSSPPRSRSWAPCTRQTAKPPAARAQASASAFAGKPVASRKMCRRVASHIRAECARRKMTKRTWNVAFTLLARFMAHPAKNGQGFSFRSQSLAVAGALHRRGNCCRGRNLLSIRWVLAFPTRRIPEFRTAESPESTGSQLQIGGGGGSRN